VRKDLYEGKTPINPIPERRPREKQARAYETGGAVTAEPAVQEARETKAAVPVQPEVKKRLWYCKQCGYVTFREDPPYVCPICKAKREMFAELEISTKVQG
jgi:rubrerythrin